ncbi:MULTISPECIES: diacylglycerol kinase family protein [unclassified Streptomyces]|uniref:diacylglycerol kinase family protein n=1 Tax=unclassified Streptomyces TaxID=2593676 RepID=UPI0011CE1014|nr:diacylglycerol kinase family protein [Streptomyces sp. me109]TXS66571.1 diacylglycerol kinase [Streptomyces sp. me109]
MTEVAASDQLLVVIDPVARRRDGESVRIAKDVLSAGAATKVCLPEGPEEFARALSRRGARRPVVVGDDRTLLRAVSLLHRQRDLAVCGLGLVPVGGSLSLARALGVPTGAVAAARAVLDGVERRLDLLVDDSDGVVLGALRIPPAGAPVQVPEDPEEIDAHAPGAHPWLRTCQSLVRTLATRPAGVASGRTRARGWGRAVSVAAAPGPSRLRVEVDGVTLVDLDQPVEAVSVVPGLPGGAVVEVRPASVGAQASSLRVVGQRVTVSGADFRYRADSVVSGPVRTRTWTVRQGGWGLTLPG